MKAGPVKELLERERELAVVEDLLGRHSGALAIEAGIGVGGTGGHWLRGEQDACVWTYERFLRRGTYGWMVA